MKRKWIWIIAFALAAYLVHKSTFMLLRHTTSASPRVCRNMDSVNPLKLVDCDSLSKHE